MLTVAKTVQIGRWGGLQCDGSPFFFANTSKNKSLTTGMWKSSDFDYMLGCFRLTRQSA